MKRRIDPTRVLGLARHGARLLADVAALADGATIEEVDRLIDDAEAFVASLRNVKRTAAPEDSS